MNDVSLAQLVEHLTFNQGVTGSNPVGHTNFTLTQICINSVKVNRADQMSQFTKTKVKPTSKIIQTKTTSNLR